MNKKLLLGIWAVIITVVPFLSHGATFKAGESFYLEPSSKINDNLYAAGSDVNIAGSAKGDLLIAGGNIMVSGPVGGDLFSAGGSINLNGKVSGDTRVLGGNIIVSNSTGGELIILGGQLNVAAGSSVAKDAEVIGGNITYNGNVGGNLNIKGGTVYVNGNVKGNLSVEAEKIKLGPNALISGNFEYSSLKEATIEEGAEVAGVTSFHQIERSGKDRALGGIFLGLITLAFFLKLLMIVVITSLALYFCKKQLNSVVGEATLNFWKQVGRGFILLVVVPAASIVSFMTIIGSPLGVIAMLSYVLLIIISLFVTVPVFAKLAMNYVFKKHKDRELNWWIMALSALALSIISLIPIIGCIFVFIVLLASFGSTTTYLYKKLKE